MQRQFNPLHLSFLQMIFDLIALMLIVYFTGSVESPLLLFFVIHMIVGSLILPGFVIYAFSVVIVLAFWGITVGEYYSMIPHHHILDIYLQHCISILIMCLQ